MSPDNIQVLVISALVLAALSVAGYYIARWLKGSIEISLPKNSYAHGETVAGSFELLARKEINGNRLFASLVATETRRERGMNGKSHTHTQEVWRTEYTVEGQKVYPAGARSRHSFSLQLPPPEGLGGSDSFLGQAAQFLFSGRTRVDWRVHVRLDAEGVDLADSKRIYVGGAPSFFGF